MAAEPTTIQKLYGGKVQIAFFENQHRYSHYRDGKVDREWLTSVTGATGQVDKSRFLIPWAVNLMKDFVLANMDKILGNKNAKQIMDLIEEGATQHEVYKKEAADLGSLVHEWCETYIKTKASERDQLPLPDDERVLNGVTAFLKWIRDNKVTFIASEKFVYSRKYDYVGTLDLKAKVNGKLSIVDFKTSKSVYNEFRYQTAAYMAADMEETKDKIEQRWILNFGKEDGEFKAYLVDGFKEDFEAFLGLLALKKREKILNRRENWLQPVTK